MATRKYQAQKFENQSSTKAVDALTVEEALQININNSPFTLVGRSI